MDDNKANIELNLVMTISEMILNHGIPMALQLIKDWNIEGEPTLEDILALKQRVPKPSSYFDD
jgi:hypothetical protein